MNRSQRLALLAVAALAFGACGGDDSSSSAPPRTTEFLAGRLLLDDNERRHPAQPCAGSGGFSDIAEGAQVVVKNEDGRTIASGRLGEGKTQIRGGTGGLGGGTFLSSCHFTFSIEDVPQADFYEVSIGRRGGQTYSHEELEEQSWTIDLELGS